MTQPCFLVEPLCRWTGGGGCEGRQSPDALIMATLLALVSCHIEGAGSIRHRNYVWHFFDDSGMAEELAALLLECWEL